MDVVVSLELDRAGTVNRQEGVARFTRSLVYPRLVLEEGYLVLARAKASTHSSR
jgi:hypothetical protein